MGGRTACYGNIRDTTVVTSEKGKLQAGWETSLVMGTDKCHITKKKIAANTDTQTYFSALLNTSLAYTQL